MDQPSMFLRPLKSLFLFVPLCTAPLAVQAQLPSPMLGRQSHNTGIRAVPAPANVKIDGVLDEWDFSGRIWTFADIAIRDRYSAETAVMWDKDFMYIALKFRDPNPLVNTINPAFDPESGWKGDALQLRIMSDWPRWITLWQYSVDKVNVLHNASWKDEKDNRKGLDLTFLTSPANSKEVGRGVQMAYLANADGKGYVQEARIPWNLIYRNAPQVEAGLTFRMGMEFFWGRAGESVWPTHRYADNLQPGETSREFFWTAKNSWGDVTLLPKGKVEELSYIMPGQKLQGTIPIKLEIPASAKEFTTVIESPEGKRIRNLGAQLDVAAYSTAVRGATRTVEVLWDGKDDAGKMVAVGPYKVRGLSHEGLGADYVMSFFNPGTPPWEAGPSSSWGADHGSPKLVTSAGDWTAVAWPFAEGGHGVIGIGPDGLKKWGEKRGAKALAGDEKSVYFISSSWHAAGNLCRLQLKNGTYQPFVLNGKERPFELPLSEIFGTPETVPGEVLAMASSGKQLAMAMAGGKIALLETSSAKLETLVDVPAPTAVAFGPQGQLFAISQDRLIQVDTTAKTFKVINTPGVQLAVKSNVEEQEQALPEVAAASQTAPLIPRTLTVDSKGNAGIFDNGPDQQVKFFSADGILQYSVGRKGGRPLRGAFNEQAMSHVTSIAADKKDQIWVTESWEFPRRVSVWGQDGKLVRDYVGNTGYAGTGTFLHDSDPTLAYYGPVEMKLDLEKRTWKVNQILWVPGAGEHFEINTSSHTHPHRFTSTAGGKKREFMFVPPYRQAEPYVLFMEGDTGWRPVSAIGMVGYLSGRMNTRDGIVLAQPEGEYAGLNAYDAFFWNDINKDGKVQFAETTIVKTKDPGQVGKKGKSPIPYMSGWGTRMSPQNMSFVTNGLGHYKPIRYTDEGAPVFGPEGLTNFPRTSSGDYVPVEADKSFIALTWEGYFGSKGLYALDAKTGEERWSYPNPYPGVHGSHRAPMPQPGLLIGPLKILGVAQLPNNNGHVFGLRGNLGQDFYFTTDGLLIGTVFQDGRLPTMALPSREADLFGAPMESYGGGGEPFTGWFGGHSDGKTRLISGMGRQVAMILEMNGFDSVKRYAGPTVTLTTAQLTTAALANDKREAEGRAGAEKKYTIFKVAAPLTITGKGTNWRAVPTFNVESSASSFKAKAQLAYDADNLYLGIEVEDPSPWKNEGIDASRLFKTGDAVDLQLAVNPAADPKRSNPALGDLRIVMGALAKKPVAILMQPVNPKAVASARKVYVSPVGQKAFDEVRPLDGAQVAVDVRPRSYRLEAAIPLKELGLVPTEGGTLKGDLGFISSDEAGRINIARTYWSSQATNLVNDEPIEAWLVPSTWGTFTWGK